MILNKTDQRTKRYLMQCAKEPLVDTIMKLNSDKLKANDSFEFINNKKDDAIDLLEEENKVMKDFITQVYEAYKDKEDRLTIQELGMYQTVKTILNIE